MGEAKQRKNKLLDVQVLCIFCGGNVIATTEEHCPPRALFRDKQWPEGYVFPACHPCNGGSSNDDLMVAFLAKLQPGANAETLNKGSGLMRMVHRQFPGLLQKMMESSAVEARAQARRLGMRPAPGQTYQELGIVNVTDAMDECVAAFAAKLSKAVYYQQTSRIFPVDGSIMFQWFTNAQRIEHGRIALLDGLAGLAAMSPPKQRAGKDLKDQFDYLYSQGENGELHVLQVVFGEVFGFVTIFSPVPGRLEAMEDRLKARAGRDDSPFRFLGDRTATEQNPGPPEA